MGACRSCISSRRRISTCWARSGLPFIDRPVRGVWDLAQAEGFPDAASDLDGWTNKRHDIVHRGQAVRIQRKQARGCIRLMAALGAAVDYHAEQATQA
jgi:hypothetical protein